MEHLTLPIKTKRGTLEALVDADSGPEITSKTWLLHQLGHPYRWEKTEDGGKIAVHLQRVVMNAPNKRVKFASNNKLDCRKINLVVSGEEERETPMLALREDERDDLIVPSINADTCACADQDSIKAAHTATETVEETRREIRTTRMPFAGHQEEMLKQKEEFEIRSKRIAKRRKKPRKMSKEAVSHPRQPRLLEQDARNLPLEVLIRELKARGATSIIF